MIKTAVITSGGDGSGVNRAIEIISRDQNIELYGFEHGFDGILKNEIVHLTSEYCENKSLDGKLLIKTSRSKLPLTSDGRKKIVDKLKEHGFEYLIIFGGNGSQQAAKLINMDGIKTLFVPMTIDNDVPGTEYSIGFDSALNRINSVIHDLHDSAYNMPGRIFIVEVLGGTCGNLALGSAIAGGGDLAIIPEFSTNRKKIVETISKKMKSKKSIIIVCSESAYDERKYKKGYQGVSFEIAEYIEKKLNIRVRKTIVGFYIRSGNTSFKDALMSSQFGELIRSTINKGISGKMVGVNRNRVQLIDFNEISPNKTMLNPSWIELGLKTKILIK